mgnify:CR=1 FL=1
MQNVHDQIAPLVGKSAKNRNVRDDNEALLTFSTYVQMTLPSSLSHRIEKYFTEVAY